MILSKLYANKDNFKKIVFKDGFNLIVGKAKEIKKGNYSHNLGKTTIINIIDFMLLKNHVNGTVLKDKEKKFKGYEFFLELKLSSGKFLTIKRSVDKNSKIYFKTHTEKNQNFISEKNWDYSNIAIKKAKIILQEELNFDCLPQYNYRKFLKFFMRREKQYDVDFGKFEIGAHVKWKAPLLEMLGFKTENYCDKLKTENKIELINGKYKDKSLSQLLNEKENLKKPIERKIKKFEHIYENFNFYELDSSITKELVDDIDKKIKSLNRIRYNLVTDIENIKETLNRTSTTLDLEEIKAVFNEVKIHFPDQLKKSYNELLKFNYQISDERKKILEKNLKKSNNDLKKVEDELLELNQKKEDDLKILSENESYKKIIQNQLIIEKAKEEITKIDLDIKDIKNQIIEMETVNGLKSKIDTFKLNFSTELIEKNDTYTKISNFLEEYTEAIFENRIGTLNTYANSEGNPNFNLSFETDEGIKTYEHKGNNYSEFLVACFDLALISAYSEKNYIKFLFHDSILESGDNRLKAEYIKLVKSICKNKNIQYITTAIEHEINAPEVQSLIEIDDIRLELSDLESKEGTLFGFSF